MPRSNTELSESDVSRIIEKAREEERRHIALELHDDLGQSMTSLKLSLKWVEDIVRAAPRMNQAAKELAIARRQVGTMLDKIRDLSHTLYPRILDSFGLVAAIKELVHQVSQHSAMTVESTVRGKPRRPGDEIELALYRCCQQALSNAIRHSKASRVSVLIHFAPAEIRLTVEDDGKGVDPRKGTGFWSIQQRMAGIGGTLDVSAAKHQGTIVEMRVSSSAGKAHARGKDKTTDRG